MKDYIEIDYAKEKRRLKNRIPKIIEILSKYNCFIAGGAITSIFTDTEINDIDVYFKNKEELFLCLWENFKNEYIVYLTHKAITYKLDNLNVQFIFMNYYKNAQNIFVDFDFSVCMGAYDIQKDKFILHKDFLKDISARKITFNPTTVFPIVSGIRIQKYRNKGFNIDILELTKILLTINRIKINNYEDLEHQLGGMYGQNIIGEIDKTKPFDIKNVINQLSKYYDEEHEFKRENEYMNKILEIEDTLLKFQKILDYKIPYFYCEERKENYLYLGKEDFIKIESEDLKDNKELYKPLKESNINKDFILYKIVNKTDGKYYSYYDKSYEYKIDEIMKPKGNNYLYVCKKENIDYTTYANEKNRALLKCKVKIEDFKELDLNKTNIEVKSLKVLQIKDLEDNKRVDELIF